MARSRNTNLPAPYLRSVWIEDSDAAFPDDYPFDLPWLTPEFELEFNAPVTILMGENGSGKSTLLETLAVLAGFNSSGGGAWSGGGELAAEDGVGALASRMRAGWLPKMQKGWFLKAQSFATVSEQISGGYLSMSHGEGFASLIQDRMSKQGVYFLDEPEAALSPARQVELLVFLSEIQSQQSAQVILATHSPILMAVPDATLLQVSHRQIKEVALRETAHFRLTSAFAADPERFVAAALAGDAENLY